MRTILYSSERATGNTFETLIFIFFLLAFAIAAAAHVRGDVALFTTPSAWSLRPHAPGP